MEKGSIVVLNLQNPREKVLGKLIEITVSGLTVRGIDMNSFSDWLNQFKGNSNGMFISPTTVFYPMHRVVSCYLDEDASSVPSFSTRFYNRTEQKISEVL
jgi:hypothetical protein